MPVSDLETGSTLQKTSVGKEKCPDCLECQICSKRRCEHCMKGGHQRCMPELGPFLTHREYMKWRSRKKDVPEKANRKTNQGGSLC
jgi:hypothetical protein